ncbi:hypothetical protein TrLO_g10409 [Triparma laevis f. longispina]|uniref:Uncharacterized protein n=1 Tax=Triparma laevis f. longispina TaxID=1714387 RepID=A0A9W7KXL4_9STRA|nr:hypothetical protein TrLO_g10409 [Triparma laevis f. longispina]
MADMADAAGMADAADIADMADKRILDANETIEDLIQFKSEHLRERNETQGLRDETNERCVEIEGYKKDLTKISNYAAFWAKKNEEKVPTLEYYKAKVEELRQICDYGLRTVVDEKATAALIRAKEIIAEVRCICKPSCCSG